MDGVDLSEYSPFFQAMAGASATLLGLLFVAISVNPNAGAVDGRDVRPWIRAASALFAFVNVLALSGFALLPGAGIGAIALGAGLTSAGSTIGMIVISVRYRHWTRRASGTRVSRTLVITRYAGWQLAFLAAYLLQGLAGWILVSVEFLGAPASPEVVDGSAVSLGGSLVIMTLLGVTRAWEAVGASMPRLVDLLLASRRPDELPPDRRRDPDEPVSLTTADPDPPPGDLPPDRRHDPDEPVILATEDAGPPSGESPAQHHGQKPAQHHGATADERAAARAPSDRQDDADDARR